MCLLADKHLIDKEVGHRLQCRKSLGYHNVQKLRSELCRRTGSSPSEAKGDQVTEPVLKMEATRLIVRKLWFETMFDVGDFSEY